MILCGMILLPVIYIIKKKSILYDEIRHVLFVIPIIAVIAGTGLSLFAKILIGLKRWLMIPAILIFSAWGIWQISLMTRLHPYEYSYYNQLSGGMVKAQKNYETEYWGASFKEAVISLEARLRQDQGKNYGKKSYKVNVCGPNFSAEHFFPKNFRIENRLDRADFYLWMTRKAFCGPYPGAPEIVSVKRAGIKFSIVQDLRMLQRPSILP
jgi:hypothetical protein